MSCNKKGVSIREENYVIYILAKDNFAESASFSKKILKKVSEKKDKDLRVELSQKGKLFSDTLFKIRQAIIENHWANAVIRTNSMPAFKQTSLPNGGRNVQTPYYTYVFENGKLKIWTSSKKPIFFDDDYAKEIASLIKSDAPQTLKIFFLKSNQERKPEKFENRVRDLKNFFVHRIEDIYSVRDASFYIGSEKNLMASYLRFPESNRLVQRDPIISVKIPLIMLSMILTPGTPVLPTIKATHDDLNISTIKEKQKKID